MREFDSQIRETATERLKAIESYLKTDAIFFFGPIVPAVKNQFRDMIEKLKSDPVKENRETISVILQTLGGSAEIVEKLVEILRHHYESVNFVIPDYAMSAGTLFALSGDEIHMDYSSSLGPIDPQDHNRTWGVSLGLFGPDRENNPEIRRRKTHRCGCANDQRARPRSAERIRTGKISNKNPSQ